MTKPDDQELEQYLKGGSALSRRYRDASREQPPKNVDEAVLALARAETRRKPRASRWLPSLALAASVVLAVNLAWNLREQAAPGSAPQELDRLGQESELAAAPEPKAKSEASAAVPQSAPAAPPPAVARRRTAPLQDAEPARSDAGSGAAGLVAYESASDDMAAASGNLEQERMARAKQAREEQRQQQALSAAADAAPEQRLAVQEDLALKKVAAPEPGAPRLTEPAKINLLLDYLSRLEGAKFIRNGTEHGTEEAVSHLRMKLEAAGDRVKTAADFIACCASQSSVSGQLYQIRFADGSLRRAQDVLREQLREIEAAETPR